MYVEKRLSGIVGGVRSCLVGAEARRIFWITELERWREALLVSMMSRSNRIWVVDSLRGGKSVGGGFGLQGLWTGVVYRTVIADFGVIVSQVFRALIL